MRMRKSRLEHELGSIVGKENVTLHNDRKGELISKVWNSAFRSLGLKTAPDAVVKPGNAMEVVNLVNYAFDKEVPLIPRGGGTSALGGAVPVNGGVVIDTKRMDKIRIDEDKKTLTAGAGVPWSRLNTKLEKKRLATGVAPLNLNSTLGGFISTGGLGIGSLRHGSVGNQIINLEVVLPVGLKINTGYSKAYFSHGFGYSNSWLFTGAEGTLGVITEATLRVYPRDSLRVEVYGIQKDGNIFQRLSKFTQSGSSVSVVFLDRELAENELEIETQGGALLLFTDEERKEDKFEEAGGATPILEEDSKIRDKLQEVYGPEGYGGEVLLPLEGVPEMFKAVEKLSEKYSTRGLAGLMVDPYSIVLRLTCGEEESGLGRVTLMGDFVRMAMSLGGRPHGSGVWNSFWMEDMFDTNTLKLMRKIKEQIDPQNIMNPYKNINYPKSKLGVTVNPSLFRATTFLDKIFKRIKP